MNWIKKNRGAIISILELIAAIVVHVSGIIDLPGEWNTVIVCIIYGIPVITAVLTSGFTSTAFQTAIDNLKKNLKSTNKENKEKLKLLNEQLATTQETLDEVNKNLSKVELLRSINAPYDVNSLALYQAQKKQLTDTVNKIKEQIGLCRDQK